MHASPMTLLAIKEDLVTAVVKNKSKLQKDNYQEKFHWTTLTMKIVCVGMILYLCLVSSLAWRGNSKPKDDDKKELLNRFMQFLAAPKGKCIDLFLS